MQRTKESGSARGSTTPRSVKAVLVAGFAAMLLAAAGAVPAFAQEPIVLEQLTPRSQFTDTVAGQIDVTLDGATTLQLAMPDLSNTAVYKITVQPGAAFPWHTHPGPVLVNVAEGEPLVYVLATDCVERPYPAGTAFVDPGRGNVHTAFNRQDGVLTFYAIFLEAPAEGPLTITEGITEPDCDLAAMQGAAEH